MRKFKFQKIDSTSDFLKDKKDKKNFDLVIADTQTSGRGRRGNKWESPKGAGLFSFCLKEDKNLDLEEDYSKLPLVVGMSLLSALKEIEDLDYKFKWTNDIYLGDNKLSGILVEKIGNFFVIGIGININNLDFLGGSINGTSLKNITDKDYDIDMIVEKVVKSFKNYWSRYVRGQWQEILFEINLHNYLYNRNIRVEFPNEVVEGIGKKILDDGRLEIMKEDESVKLVVGEVHIKL